MPRKLSLWAGAVLLSSCAGLSSSQKEQLAQDVARFQAAKAVYMPKAGVKSCLTPLLKLSQGETNDSLRQKGYTKGLSEVQIADGLQPAGIEHCQAQYQQALLKQGLLAERVAVSFAYGIDVEGQVCGAVEWSRPEPLDPGLTPLIDAGAKCAKQALLNNAHFAKPTFEQQALIVRVQAYLLDKGTKTSTSSSTAAIN